MSALLTLITTIAGRLAAKLGLTAAALTVLGPLAPIISGIGQIIRRRRDRNRGNPRLAVKKRRRARHALSGRSVAGISLPSLPLHRGRQSSCKAENSDHPEALPGAEDRKAHPMTPELKDSTQASRQPHAGSKGFGEISLTRIYLPFAMVITFGAFLAVAGYTAGGIMSGIARDKTETEKRLSAIEKEVTAIKNILSERAEIPAACFGRPK